MAVSGASEEKQDPVWEQLPGISVKWEEEAQNQAGYHPGRCHLM